jgi:ComF family protein
LEDNARAKIVPHFSRNFLARPADTLVMKPIERLPRRIFRAALALIYPARCATCDQLCDEEAAFCELCAETLEPIGAGCDRCGLPLAGSRGGPTRCLQCLERPPPFSTARAPFQFGGALARAIRRFKWARLPELARPLGRLLRGSHAPGGDAIVPVPLHPRRLRVREFNQAALLAYEARGRRGPPVDVQALERVRDTPPQTELGVTDRRANVRGAFRAHPDRVRGKVVTLIDDVMTTGATAEACTRALLDAGAREVAVLTLARAMP